MARRHESLIPLSKDHYEGLLLASQITLPNRTVMKGWPARPAERAHFVVDFYQQHLRLHFLAEEESLFPLVLKHVPEEKDLVDDLLKEHRAMEKYIEEFRKAEDETVADKLREFATILEAHIRREERGLFPVFETRVPPEILNEAKKLIHGHYHPR